MFPRLVRVLACVVVLVGAVLAGLGVWPVPASGAPGRLLAELNPIRIVLGVFVGSALLLLVSFVAGRLRRRRRRKRARAMRRARRWPEWQEWS